MATADELLASGEIEVLSVNLDTRVISIPASLTILGVESDDDVKHLRFNIPRYYKVIDLSEFQFQVNFENARGSGDFYPIKDVEINDDVLSFVWVVDRSAFMYPGDVTFSICMKKYDENGVVVKELNTAPAELPVLKGLETTKEVVENNPSAFDAVLFRLYAVEAATGLGQGAYYSVLEVEEQEDGVVITVRNNQGETTAVIRNGDDGHTPVRGVDYFTEEDVQAIKNDNKLYVDQWAPKAEVITLSSTKWSNNRQTVAVPGVTSDNLVIPAPEPTTANYEAYVGSGIRCVSQATNSLTFVCGSVPSTNVTVNVAIFYSSDIANGSGGHTSFTVTDDGNGNVSIM